MASAGPANSATLLDMVTTAVACWMSGSGTVCGSSPEAAGRKNASALPNSTSMTTTCQIRAEPEKISTASTACSAKRTRSVAIITRWRGRRSAHTPPSSRKLTSDRACAASTSPRSAALPVSPTTNSASATSTMLSPITLEDCASHSRRKSRCPSTRRISLRFAMAPVSLTQTARRAPGCSRGP